MIMAILVLGAIGLTLLIYLLQKQKYFYLHSYFLKRKNDSLILRLKANGNYVINQTFVPQNPNDSFQFDIIEGQYQNQHSQITLKPINKLEVTFPNLNAFMHNQVEKVAQDSNINNKKIVLQLCQSNLFWHKLKLIPIQKSKVIRIKQYQKQLVTS